MILTAAGLVAIEHIKAGNKVVSTNPETFEVAEKAVLETYVRETTELVHLTINGELIKTTYDHPFYVKDVGFVSAGELYIGDKLLDSNGNTLLLEDREVENLDEPVKVYNFQVEDFHTYHVGENGTLVHNADYLPTEKQPGFIKRTDNKDGSVTITKKIDGKEYDLTYTKGDDGHLYARFEPYADYKNPDFADVDFSKPIKSNQPLNGNYQSDATMLNKQIGLTETPNGYVWHHIEDGESMLLVPQKIHSVKFGGFTHRGGASVIRLK